MAVPVSYYIAYDYFMMQYNSSELGEELCSVSSSLPLRVHKLYIRVSFFGHFFKMAAALCCIQIAVIINRENTFPFIPYWVMVVC